MPTVELETPDKLEYTFHPVNAGSVHFKVKAANDAHIALTTGPAEADPMVEIFIGGWGNSKSVIRRDRTKPDKVEVETPDILSGDEERGFWVRWQDGLIEAGKEGEDAAILSWQDPEPFTVSHVGFCTGWGASGAWKIEDIPEISDICPEIECEGREELLTADKLEYHFRRAPVGAIEIDVRTPSNAHIALTSGPAETEPMYEIILGGWENSASVIRYNRTKPDKVRVETPGLCTSDAFRRFVVQWSSGLLTVVGPDGAELLSWQDDSEPVAISHFGVRTAWGASGSWRVRSVDPRKRRGAAPAPISVAPGIMPPGWAIPGAQTAAVGWAIPPEPASASGTPTWVDASNGEVPPNAVSGGFDNEEIYVARAQHEGALIPGKLVPSHGVCYVAWGGAEHGKDTYQVLCGCTATWVPSSNGEVPPNALPAGESEDGEPLFAGRAQHEGTVTLGKIQASHNVCYIPFGGQEIGYPDYEVLVAQ